MLDRLQRVARLLRLAVRCGAIENRPARIRRAYAHAEGELLLRVAVARLVHVERAVDGRVANGRERRALDERVQAEGDGDGLRAVPSHPEVERPRGGRRPRRPAATADERGRVRIGLSL